MTKILIQVQTAPFDINTEEARLANGFNGASVVFIGRVRANAVGDLCGLSLEHYAGLTEQSLENIAQQAAIRWTLQAISIIHRVGYLALGEAIVLVIVASAHRAAAFAANEFIMDMLKTQAPFWKKEHFNGQASHWVESKKSDLDAAASWLE